MCPTFEAMGQIPVFHRTYFFFHIICEIILIKLNLMWPWSKYLSLRNLFFIFFSLYFGVASCIFGIFGLIAQTYFHHHHHHHHHHHIQYERICILSIGVGNKFDSLCLFVCLSVCLSVCLFVCLSVCLKHNSKSNDPKVFKHGIWNDLWISYKDYMVLGLKGHRLRLG